MSGMHYLTTTTGMNKEEMTLQHYPTARRAGDEHDPANHAQADDS